MTYISVQFYLFLIGSVIIYYLMPIKVRWVVLLIESLTFYCFLTDQGRYILLLVILISYLGAILLQILPLKHLLRRILFGIFVLATAIPLIIFKEGNYIVQELTGSGIWSFTAPLGLSFVTIQIISYLTDVYKCRVKAQKNPLKYMLYTLFFPQVIQGPIPRYEQLMHQLETGNRFEPMNITLGFQLILWGFFLKFMIADKAAVVVNTVFNNCSYYKGAYVIFAGVLYSIQLYADFQACTKISQGIAKLFGINLVNNFYHPYFARSIKEFWGRWHISFSKFLKDYIYIPLGGNRKGKLRKYINLLITFLISGLWHGSGLQFLIWGGLHAIYQIAGDCTYRIRRKFYAAVNIQEDSNVRNFIKRICTFALITFAWIIFRANSLEDALMMIKSIFTIYNPWVLFSDSVFSLGLSWKEMMVLLTAILILYLVSYAEERGFSLLKNVLTQPLIARWAIYICVIIVVMVFGTYGYGTNPQDFIYGGF